MKKYQDTWTDSKYLDWPLQMRRLFRVFAVWSSLNNQLLYMPKQVFVNQINFSVDSHMNISPLLVRKEGRHVFFHETVRIKIPEILLIK